MTDPISNAFSSAWHYWNDPVESDALTYCQKANTVTAGALCNEPTVVSDACRTPTTDVDAFVCDDPQMADAQHTLLGTVKDVALTILGVFAGRP
jgi:hypothetical protein